MVFITEAILTRVHLKLFKNQNTFSILDIVKLHYIWKGVAEKSKFPRYFDNIVG